MTFDFVLSFIAGGFSAGLAFYVLCRDRRSLARWIFAGGMIVLSIEAVFSGLSFRAMSPAEIVHWQRLRLAATAFIPGIWLVFSLTFARTNYKDFIEKWRWVIIAVFVVPISIITIFGNHFFAGKPIMDLPFQGLLRIDWAGYFFHVFLLVGAVLILMNLERTLHTSGGIMRWQIKFLVLGLASLFGVRIYVISQILLFRSLNLDLEILNNGTFLVAGLLMLKSFARSRLSDADFYLSPSFLHNSFTVLFVGIYLIVVGILAKLATYFESSLDLPLEAFFVSLALLGLAVLLLSGSLRRRMKKFISRNFNRPLYDYRQQWTTFTQWTTSVTEIKDLCFIITKMVSKSLDVPSVSIWLVDESQERAVLGGSMVFSEGNIPDAKAVEKDLNELIHVMRQKIFPFDFDYSKGDWRVEKEEGGEYFFRRTWIRHALPLLAGGKFLGLLTLGDRVGKEPLSVEDFDLLKTVADQTAGSLLNLKLSADLRKAKEMEAFQRMSAFFVHDLKNLASRLSLTVQNLPIHFANAEFRNDAVRTISESLTKINGMCTRLSSLSQKLELKHTQTDLNELVKNTLSGLDGCLRTSPVVDLNSVLRLVVDPEQILKVLVNLILNANEAISEGGEIRVITMQEDGFVVLTVSDTGCGMSQEFIEKSLYHPFQTTKKQGMGIGLYQSKMIVGAHGGKIEVESEEGRGTTFRVLLPIHAPARE